MKIIRLTENDLARIVRRVINEKVTTLTTTVKPVAAPSQSYNQTLVTVGELGNFPAKNVTLRITPKGKGQYQINVNDSMDSGKIVTGGVAPSPDYRVVIQQMPATFGNLTLSDVNALDKQMRKMVNKIVLALPKA
jgi:hypothetical protein